MNPRFGLALLLLAGAVDADERILDYKASVAITPDACVSVEEIITARVENNRIRHGIYRDFPTDYRDPLGHRYRVSFEVLSAHRDGTAEAWKLERKSNGMRVYLGDADSFVAVGEHVYELRYRTCRQAGFFADHDELFWNVTGTGWAFPIDAASAEVFLPYTVAADRLKALGYTGKQGSREQALAAETFDGGARFRASRPLAPNEGLSVVLEFPKGILAEPTRKQRLIWLLQDNATLECLLIGLVLLWLYYGWAWRSYGRDPAASVLMPQYEPPAGFSPASLRYIRQMRYDQGCFTAAVLGLAAKGWLQIEQDGNDVVTLRRTGRDVEFGPGEHAVAAGLKLGHGGSLRLKQSEGVAKVMRAAQKAQRQALAGDYERKYFFTHRDKLVPGWLISVVTLLAAIMLVPGEEKPAALGICLWLCIWSLGVYALVSAAINASRRAKGASAGVGAAFLWLFALPFIGGEVAGLWVLGTMVGIGPVLGLVVLIGTNIAFLHWMKAPTLDGARLLEKIEGFRWYLGVAEKQELDSRYKPESRPELFSDYLPYAFALGVEQAWAQNFADALPRDQVDRMQPVWYQGSNWNSSSLAGFTSGLSSSLSSSISSASSAPGSSSGSGGGSGGGGGGGGGGGW